MTDFIESIESKKRIGIIDADLLDGGTRHPNLALMKISGYCKSQGCEVTLMESYNDIESYDIVFVSKVFTFTWSPPDLTKHENVFIGGTGFFADGGKNLPHVVEHHMPDYKLYESYVQARIEEGRSRSWFADYLDYSIGFTTRGCFRKCSFCVNKKYSHAFKHSPVSEFLDVNRPYIYLWDDNFFAYPKWHEILTELERTGKPFQFRQGLDIRLLDRKKAKRLASVRYKGDFIFAFDHIEDRKIIERGLGIWRDYTVRGTRLYVLCAYDSQDEQDITNTFERIRILMHYGCLPYIMRYESYKHCKWKRLYVNIARWCNQPQFFKKKSFRQFCEANQEYHKNKATKCSALQSMEEFEAEFPEIAARYFDLRYEEQNMMLRHGRKFFGKPTEEVTREQSASWQRFRDGTLDERDVLRLYFDKSLDIVWAGEFCEQDYTSEIDALYEVLDKARVDDIYECLLTSDYREPISPENIPQYSSIEDICRTTFPLRMLDESVTFEEMGMYLCPEDRKADAAHKKYGENHGKCAALLDLAYVVRDANRTAFKCTPFSNRFDALPVSEKHAMIAKLALRIPILRRMLVDAHDGEVQLGDYMMTLAKTTRARRRPNVIKLLDLIVAETGDNSPLQQAAGNIGREL